jgi:hypothetical protein
MFVDCRLAIRVRQSIRRDADHWLWLRIAALGDLPARITPHVLRHCSASLQ